MTCLDHKGLKIGLAVVALLALSRGAGAVPYRHQNGLHEYRSVAPSRWDRHRFHRSGTRGRMGLGADPRHPEGPSNVSE